MLPLRHQSLFARISSHLQDYTLEKSVKEYPLKGIGDNSEFISFLKQNEISDYWQTCSCERIHATIEEVSNVGSVAFFFIEPYRTIIGGINKRILNLNIELMAVNVAVTEGD